MAVSESQLIERYFASLARAATIPCSASATMRRCCACPHDCELVLTTDALVEGVHFLPGAAPRALGHRALAVNLSDIAAMGASPSWALLSLNLPLADEHWLGEFAAGFGALARAHRWHWWAATSAAVRCRLPCSWRAWFRQVRHCGAAVRKPETICT